MIKDLVQAVGQEFTAFLRPFERFFDNQGTVQHFRTYTRGLLTDLDRKTAEPLAQYAGTPRDVCSSFTKPACGTTTASPTAFNRSFAPRSPTPARPGGHGWHSRRDWC